MRTSVRIKLAIFVNSLFSEDRDSWYTVHESKKHTDYEEARVMMRAFRGILSLAMLMLGCNSVPAESMPSARKLLDQGHGSLRIVTGEGKERY